MSELEKHRHRRRCRGLGRRRVGNAEEMVAKLESYQRDLEQEVADVADVIRRLKADRPEPSTA